MLLHIIVGALGAVPALIIRFGFKKRFRSYRAYRWAFLCMLLSIIVQVALFNSMNGNVRLEMSVYGAVITFALSLWVLRDPANDDKKDFLEGDLKR
jgi:hypothetical protein